MALTQISTAGVKDDAVTAGKIPANAVGSSELADNAVDTAAIADDAVTDAKLANSINTAIAANTAKNTNATHTGDVTGSTSLTIANDAVTTAKIADNAVNMNKLSDLDNGRIIARVSSGAGNPEAATAAQVRNVLNVADGATQTTINNNADNRVITGSGTANTLNGQQNLTFNGSLLEIDQGTSDGTSFNLKNEELNCAFGVHGTGSSYPREAIISPSRMDSGSYPILRLAGQGGIKFAVDANTERMRIDSSGNVGIGTTSPDQKLKIQDSNDLAIHLLKTGSQDTLIRNTGQTEICAATGGASGQRIAFKIGANTGSMPEIAKFTPDGLCFGSDTAAANSLDDYEEGSCVPTQVNGSFSPSAADGKYTKVGRLVTWMMHITFDSTGSNNHLRIGNLPFTAGGGRSGAAIVRYSNDDEAFKIAWHVDAGDATATAYYSNGGGTVPSHAVSQKRFDLTFVYEAAS